MTIPISGRREFQKQEKMYLYLAGFVRYFRDERGMTRDQVIGIVDNQIESIDRYRLFTDLDGNPLDPEVKAQR